GLVPLDTWFARWVGGTRRVLGPLRDDGGVARLATYDVDTGAVEVVTSPDLHATTGQAWLDPVHGDLVAVALRGAEIGSSDRIEVWRRTPAGWKRTVELPAPPALQNVSSPELIEI